MLAAMTTPAIEVRGLRVERGGRLVLPELDVDVAAGRITGLVGPSGEIGRAHV